MLIKNFQAESMHEAMKKVKTEFGNNAVILNSQVVEEKTRSGVRSRKRFEITAGKDIPAGMPAPRIPAVVNRVEPLQPQAREASGGSDIGIVLRRFEKEIKYLVESQKEIRALLKVPNQARPLSSALEMHDLDRDLLGNIFEYCHIDNTQTKIELDAIRAGLLNLCTHPQPIKIFGSGTNKIAFIGPPASGKTSLIGKIATSFVFESKIKTTLINMDDYKPAALTDLNIYANLLKITCQNSAEWRENRREKEFNVVLADTAGIPVGAQDDLNNLKEKLNEYAPDEIHLVLPAYCSWRECARWLEFFRQLHPTQAAVTFMDQTETYGLPFNLAGARGLKLSYLSWGRNKSDSLEEAELFSLSEKLFAKVEDSYEHYI